MVGKWGSGGEGARRRRSVEMKEALAVLYASKRARNEVWRRIKVQFSTCRRRRVGMEPNTTYVYGEKVVPINESSTRDVNRGSCS